MNADTQIFQDLLAGFKSGPLAQHAQLSVDVHNGIVTIAGRVNTLAERKAVERAAKRVHGIRTLIIKIGAAALTLSALDTAKVTRNDTAQKAL